MRKILNHGVGAFGNVLIGWVLKPAISIRESVSMSLDVLKDKTKYSQYTCCNMFLALFRKLRDCLSVQIDHFDRSLPAPSRAFNSHEFLLMQLVMAPGILPSLCATRYRICLLIDLQISRWPETNLISAKCWEAVQSNSFRLKTTASWIALDLHRHSASLQRQRKETPTKTAPPTKRAFSNYRIQSQWGAIVIYANEFVFKWLWTWQLISCLLPDVFLTKYTTGNRKKQQQLEWYARNSCRLAQFLCKLLIFRLFRTFMCFF